MAPIMGHDPNPFPARGGTRGLLALSPAMLANLQQLGYTEMTPIQAASLPPALLGKDLIAQAKTGSGKTAAFALALLANLNPRRFAVQALVLCPTRELADQVTTEIRRLARAEENIKVVTLCGGVPLRNQLPAWKTAPTLPWARPGASWTTWSAARSTSKRSTPWCWTRPTACWTWGFSMTSPPWRKQCPKERQTLLFSATYPEGIAKLSAQFMREPVRSRCEAQHASGKIQQRWYEVKNSERLHAVSACCSTTSARPARWRFATPRQQCRDLVAVLQAQGFSALALYGELEQRERDQVLVQFANRSCSVLVATDVAARGLDIANLAAVINVDVTPDPEVHIHRIGRTGPGRGRAGAEPGQHGRDGLCGQDRVLQGRESRWHPLAELTPTGSGPLVPPMATCRSWAAARKKSAPVTCWAR
jgi:ATP-independent RNA helicase DbpA